MKKNNLKESWQPVPGFEGLYEASNLGEIRSLWFGKVKVLKPMVTRGYLRVMLYKDGKRKKFSVHRLVWISFRGPIPKGMQINHLNENKLDNRLSNLEKVTAKQNTNHGTRNERAGKALKGKKHSEETKAKISASKKGKPRTEETKAKISASMKARRELKFRN